MFGLGFGEVEEGDVVGVEEVVFWLFFYFDKVSDSVFDL